MTIRISGTGGQGIISTGIVLGHAMVVDGYEVVQTQSYGAESRGGAAKADLIVSDNVIYELGLREITHFIVRAPSAWEKYQHLLVKDAFILVDEEKVTNATGKVYAAPFTRWSQQEYGNTLFTNMIILGAFAKLIGIPHLSALEEAIKETLPRYHDENIQAVHYGYSKMKKETKQL